LDINIVEGSFNKESLSTIDVTLYMDGNLFDTANVYCIGYSKELLSKAKKGRCKKFIVASKIGWVGFDKLS